MLQYKSKVDKKYVWLSNFAFVCTVTYRKVARVMASVAGCRRHLSVGIKMKVAK